MNNNDIYWDTRRKQYLNLCATANELLILLSKQNIELTGDAKVLMEKWIKERDEYQSDINIAA